MRPPPRDREMRSPDLIEPQTWQIFSVATGDRIGYEGRQSDMQFDTPTETPADPAQMALEL